MKVDFPCFDSTLVARSHALTVQRFGKVIQLYAPLYLSNECVDTCLYCGFSRHLKIARKTLRVPEVLEEAAHLKAERFRHILLVSAEHPFQVSVPYLCEVVANLRQDFASVGIEVAPFNEADYRRLLAAGVDIVVIYQETYQPEVYQSVHLGGPKRNFEKRLEAIEEACRAGLSTVGMGVLLGLSPWKEELRALITHVKRLMKKYWRTRFTVSLPRLKGSAAGYQPPYPVSDRDLAYMICLIRISLPDVGIVLSTREGPKLRDQLFRLGVTQMSAGSKTEPGGYIHPSEAAAQFELEDHRSPTEVAAAIVAQGYEPVWKDWDGALRRNDESKQDTNAFCP